MRGDTAEQLGLSLQDFDAFLAFLADSEACGLVHQVDGVLTTDRTQEDLARVQENRKMHRNIASGQRRGAGGRFHRSNGEVSARDGDRTVVLRAEKEPNLPSFEGEKITQNTVDAGKGNRCNGEPSTANGRAATVDKIRLDINIRGAAVDNSVDNSKDGDGRTSNGPAPPKKQSREERVAEKKRVLQEQARLLGVPEPFP